ncbi:MAG: hypothetical protein QXE90_01670 [Candidatus Micrarchaeia archaeon]
MREFGSKSPFKNRAIDSLESLDSAAKKLKDKIKTSELDDDWFKKINSNDYATMARSIELWINILEHAEIQRRIQKK